MTTASHSREHACVVAALPACATVGSRVPPPYWLRVADVKGTYTIPYIQSNRDLTIRVDFAALPAAAEGAVVFLYDETGKTQRRTVIRNAPAAVFPRLLPREYLLFVSATDRDGHAVWLAEHSRIGVGTVVAALGDSLTEGYHGADFWCDSLDLRSDAFPPEAVSADGRNYPQFAPTSAHHKPAANCFQSWMTRLNNRLTEAWKHPVFIANEGWGGYTSAHYLAMMRGGGGGWRTRMARLQPTLWLVHLGVNDERHGVAPLVFGDNLRAIVGILRDEYRARPNCIYVARPSYDYAPGAAQALQRYIAEIDLLIEELGLWPGPDFFEAFSADRRTWYGSDPVHPGPSGMERMGDLWLAALTGSDRDAVGPDLRAGGDVSGGMAVVVPVGGGGAAA